MAGSFAYREGLAETEQVTNSAELQNTLQHSESFSIVLPWYVVHTKPRQEQLALENLKRQAYQCYLPQIKLFKRVRGKQHIQLEPLFPRYLFVQPESSDHSIASIRSTLGVASLVCFGNQPALMRAASLDEVRAFELANHEMNNAGRNPFQRGKRVRVVDGPLDGLEGLVSTVSRDRVDILLHLLGRETCVNLSQHQLMVAG